MADRRRIAKPVVEKSVLFHRLDGEWKRLRRSVGGQIPAASVDEAIRMVRHAFDRVIERAPRPPRDTPHPSDPSDASTS